VQISVDVAAAMAYLHEELNPAVVHRDLKVKEKERKIERRKNEEKGRDMKIQVDHRLTEHM
jgi:hypothetical protein